ncbi:MAG: sensor histidine kinase [Rectinemataceae bacterium]
MHSRPFVVPFLHWINQAIHLRSPTVTGRIHMLRGMAFSTLFLVVLAGGGLILAHALVAGSMNFLAMGSIAACGLGLLLFLGLWYCKPLEAFNEAVSRIGRGDYSAGLRVRSSAEFRDLAIRFNRMTEELAAKEAILAAKEAILKAEVASRAAELTQARLKLGETREALHGQEKLASLGALAAGIAHEVNSPLAFVLSNLHSLSAYTAYTRNVVEAAQHVSRMGKAGDPQAIALAKLELDAALFANDPGFVLDDMEELITESETGATRIKDIVDWLRSYPRNEVGSRAACNVDEVLRSSLRIVAGKLRHNCIVETDFGAPPPVVGLPGKLEQVFINLLTNAYDAIQERGTVRLRSALEGDWVLVSVSDDGIGMEAVTISRIFEPFFTTKEAGKGTGLGLSISRGIVEEFGGRLDVASEPGRGSTFTLRLPALARLSETPPSILVQEAAARGSVQAARPDQGGSPPRAPWAHSFSSQ